MRRPAVGVMAAVSVGACVALGPHLGAQGARGGGRGEGQTVILAPAPAFSGRDSDGEARPASQGHGCEEASDASDDRRREVQRQHPADYQRGDGADAPEHDRPVGRARRFGHADDGRHHRERQVRRRRVASAQGRRVTYLPAGLPHGVSGVNGNITWLNVRWDTDWPADSQPGAGNFQGPGRGGARGAAQRGEDAAGAPGAARGEGGARAGGAARGGGFPGPLRDGGSGEISSRRNASTAT